MFKLPKFGRTKANHRIDYHFLPNFSQGHQTYNKFLISDREKQLFSMRGSENRSERAKLYKFMLENMNDEDRFQTTYRLCQDVLNGVVEGQVRIKGTCCVN